MMNWWRQETEEESEMEEIPGEEYEEQSVYESSFTEIAINSNVNDSETDIRLTGNFGPDWWKEVIFSKWKDTQLISKKPEVRFEEIEEDMGSPFNDFDYINEKEHVFS